MKVIEKDVVGEETCAQRETARKRHEDQHEDLETERQAWRYNIVLDTIQQRSRAAGRGGQPLRRDGGVVKRK